MSFIAGTGLLGLAGLIYLSWRQARRQNADIEQFGFHAAAVVRSYQKEYVRVAGSWHWLEYPYVEYTNKYGDVKLERLKYAQSPGQPFTIGETVEVVGYDGVLYYRQGLREGNRMQLGLALAALVAGLVVIIQSF